MRKKSSATDTPRGAKKSHYPLWFYLPGGIIFIALFIVPTAVSFFFSLTRWTIFDWEFIGLDNFINFFKEPQLVKSLTNTAIYAVVTSGLKVVIGLFLGALLTMNIAGRGYLRSVVFFPVLVSTVGVGITFQVLLHPFDGLVNKSLEAIGITGPGWLTDPQWALLSVAFVDVWKGVGLATVIYIAGITAIPREYYEAAEVDGATWWQRFRNIVLPLSWPATSTVILLSFIGGLRSFDLIWTMTKGGPGFTSDVIASVIYKQYQAGFYGLSTAGNVILFILIALIVMPISHFLTKKEVDQ
ncbi:sugar ABC transporter permease [Jonesiaceae bacterium BS-20]|uniref:Sugar ABC transporter permease n=1 Tax=Jonesiaceae bacterium BS-20 TaxID=3120821 RepID=A0AAU7E085_9MICO